IEPQALLKVLAERGIPTHEFTHKRLSRRQLPIARDTLVAGQLDAVRLAFQLLGVAGPFMPTYPKSLQPMLGRDIWESTVGAAQMHVERTGRPLFIKPLSQAKRFTGFVMRDGMDAFQLHGSSKQLPVLCSQVVSMVHEYRAYVVEHEVAAFVSYTGKAPTPPLHFAAQCVAELLRAQEAPRGFALDVGLLETGELVVVECNDGFGLGLYEGVSFEVYTDLVCARWEELLA
ncbi:MAG: ATP-grasp domain-containing protein, partial [Myxococcota bacterium]